MVVGRKPGAISSYTGSQAETGMFPRHERPMTDATNGPARGERIPWSWSDARTILERTPAVLERWLAGLGEPWLHNDEGGFAMLSAEPGPPLDELLDTFARLRRHNLETVDGFELGEKELDLPGTHPELGPVTLRQLLATWATHDLTHLGQIARVMAQQWTDEVGPWRAYLPLLDR